MHVVSHLLIQDICFHTAFSLPVSRLVIPEGQRGTATHLNPRTWLSMRSLGPRELKKVEVVRKDRPDGIMRVHRRVLYAFVQVLFQKDSNGVLKTS